MSIFAQYSLPPRPSFALRSGLSLLELLIFLAVMAIAMSAALSMYISSRMAQRIGEERRLASLVAEQKLDEIRNYIAKGHSLDQAFLYYGPISDVTTPANLESVNPYVAPLPNHNAPPFHAYGGPGAWFDVPGLDPFFDTNPSDGSRSLARSIGTVSIINDETPDERQFGYDYGNGAPQLPFGVDINGNGSRLIQTGFGGAGAAGYNSSVPLPFPLDLNGSGSNGGSVPWNHNVTNGFVLLPVVITIQWQGAAGPQRYDLFGLITPDQVGEPH